MEALLFHNSQLVTFSLLLCAFLATIGTMIVVRRAVTISNRELRHFFELRFKPAAFQHLDKFERSLFGYQEVADLLSKYAGTFSSVYNEANWTKFIIYLSDLNGAHHEINRLLTLGESKRALCLANFLACEGESIAEWRYRYVGKEWRHLQAWEPESYQIICTVVKNLDGAVREAQAIGIHRESATDETLEVLAEIRSHL